MNNSRFSDDEGGMIDVYEGAENNFTEDNISMSYGRGDLAYSSQPRDRPVFASGREEGRQNNFSMQPDNARMRESLNEFAVNLANRN